MRYLKLDYKQLQTVLLGIETILNNQPLTYRYTDENEPLIIEIILWDFMMLYQIFLSSQVKQSAIISNKQDV